MDKTKIVKKYTNGEVTIVWQSEKCIHSKKCWNESEGLRSVFNPRERPWIKPEGASTEKIIEHVCKCPSGALSFYMNHEEDVKKEEITTEQVVEIVENGPLLVYGNITVKDKEGNQTQKNKVTAFCRCGQSNNKPYCDGSHVKCGFKG
ncbi:MAG: hypothetical protein HOP11_04400 [Saprospiraceae bacterium]|nr:hypothetical protein [Saprospiraceae bacterium]